MTVSSLTIRTVIVIALALIALFVLRRRRQNPPIRRFVLSPTDSHDEFISTTPEKRARSVGYLGIAILAAGISLAFMATVIVTYLITLATGSITG